MVNLTPEPEAAPPVAKKKPIKPEDLTVPKEKFDAQKKVLQRLTLRLLEHGTKSGLTAEEASALKESLDVLGWVPRDIRL